MASRSVLFLFIVACPAVAGVRPTVAEHQSEHMLKLPRWMSKAYWTGPDGPKNIYGRALERCRKKAVAAAASEEGAEASEEGPGSSEMCNEQDRPLCISELPEDFAATTGQADLTEHDAKQNTCVSVGAWSMYIKAHPSSTYLVCRATSDFVLSYDSIDHWNKWHDTDLPDGLKKGVFEFFHLCMDKNQAMYYPEGSEKWYELLPNRVAIKTRYCCLAETAEGQSIGRDQECPELLKPTAPFFKGKCPKK